MNKHLMLALIAVIVSSLIGPAVPVQTAAAPTEIAVGPDQPAATPTETGVYAEDFATYMAKDYTEGSEWDIWAHSLLLAPVDDRHQMYSTIVSDRDGNVLVAWIDDRSGKPDIYIQKLNADGNRLWPSAVRANSHAGSVHRYSFPAIAINVNGIVFLAWQDERNGDFDIYSQAFDAGGNRLWTADFRVDSDIGSAIQLSPSITVDGNGNALAVWWDYRNSYYADIYAQKLDVRGNRLWETDKRVTPDAGAARQDRPGVAVVGDNNALVVWRDGRNGHSDIYAQKLDVNGNRLWTVDRRVNTDTSAVEQWHPAVAIDGAGNAFVVWIDERNCYPDIYAQKLDIDGRPLYANDIRVNVNSGTVASQYPIAVATDRDSSVFVTWTDGRNGHWDAYSQAIESNGNRLYAADIRINPDTTRVTPYATFPTVAAPEMGRAIIVWNDDRSLNQDIYAQKLDVHGVKLWRYDVRISSGSGSVGQYDPDIAADKAGNVTVVWTDGRNRNADIYVEKFSINGSKVWVSDRRVSFDTAIEYYGALTRFRSGEAFVVWEERSGDGWNVLIQKIDANGNLLWPNSRRVNSDYGTASPWAYPAVVADGAGGAFVGWKAFPDRVYVQRLDADGNRQWSADLAIGTGDFPIAATDGIESAIFLFTSSRDIYAQKVDVNGNQLWPIDRRVNLTSNTVYPYSSAGVALDESGNALIVWGDERNGRIEVYAQKLGANGSQLWQNDVQVSSGTGILAPYTSPSIAVFQNEVFVVWTDGRNNNTDIYAQKLDRGGSRLWAQDKRVNSDIGLANQWDPVAASEHGFGVFVAWSDYRNGDSDIYLQRLDSEGSPGWQADLQVVSLDVFYFPAGTAQSRTIDTLPGDIRQATLTSNYQTNGGDVQFFLTNNGGADWFSITPGVTYVFTTTGSDLRWRAELTADPLWPRTPVVNSLRIEYSTALPYADDYEPDDACSQARPIAVNGAAQSHTFHQQADADWAWFDAVAGATYIVETRNTGARANTVIEPRPTCTAPPTGGGRSFGNGYTISFTAPATGRYYLKVYNHDPAVSGQGTDYTLSVRASRPAAVSVIVAGHDGLNSAQENITFAADRAYRIFRNAGIGQANIRYLAPQASHDADGDGANDIAGLPTVANVRDTVQDWARERGVALGVPFYLYLVDHGLVDRFKADGDVTANQVTAADLNLWLSNLEATTGTDNINVVIDACYSGSFIDETTPGPATISGRNRVIVASTTSDWQAYGPADGQGLYFSNAFFGALENQQSLWASFQAGSQAVEAQGMLQRPWLDDNGDRRFSSDDGALATGRALRRVALGGQAPCIEWVSGDARIGLVRAKTSDDSGWVGVKVEVFAPSYVPPQPDGNGTTRIINVPVVTLADPDGDGVYEGRYTFAETGQYRLVAHAEDSEGNLALPAMTAVSVSAASHPVYLPVIVR